MKRAELEGALLKLLGYVKRENYLGYDPYDALVSPRLRRVGPRAARKIIIQANKFLPFNLRPLLKVDKGLDVKGQGIFANAYHVLFRATNDRTHLEEGARILQTLRERSLAARYKDHCWAGHYFSTHTLAHSEPDVISTCMCGEAFLKHAALSGDKESAEIAESAGRFIRDLLLAEDGRSCFIKYSPGKADVHVYNATAIAAAFLSKLANPEMRGIAERCLKSVVAAQNRDGSWDYSISLSGGRRRRQLDFHQGYIIEALHEAITALGEQPGPYRQTLSKGLSFYMKEQFTSSGASYWRLPLKWPVDIHNQAQGIITLAKLSRFEEGCLPFAQRIASWTVLNMQDKRGYFYYQKWPFLTNRIPHMRWGQAWMMLALATLLEAATVEASPEDPPPQRTG